MAGKFTDRDKGYAAMLKRIKSGATVTVGVHEAEGAMVAHGGEASVAEIGSFHEFGLGHNPRRSFIADWSDENKSRHEGELRKIAGAVLKGKVPSAEKGLERFGVLAKGQVQTRIRDGIEPPLDPKTIERKGSSTPLIDTGVLRSSIEFEVKKS